MRTPSNLKNNRLIAQDQLEKRIDAAIDMAAVQGESVVKVHILGARKEVVDIVLADYRKIGWTVDVVSDYRNGDYLKLVAP